MDLEFILILIVTVLMLGLSVVGSRKKTLLVFKMSARRFIKIFPMVVLMVLLLSITFLFIPAENLSEYLGGENLMEGTALAALIGSISLMPGFIAFPLGGALKDSGIPYMVISALTSSLMMVGILTLPVERQYLGLKVSLLRNFIYFLVAVTVALVTGLVYGELL